MLETRTVFDSSQGNFLLAEVKKCAIFTANVLWVVFAPRAYLPLLRPRVRSLRKMLELLSNSEVSCPAEAGAELLSSTTLNYQEGAAVSHKLFL